MYLLSDQINAAARRVKEQCNKAILHPDQEFTINKIASIISEELTKPGTGWTRPDGLEFFGQDAIRESTTYWSAKFVELQEKFAEVEIRAKRLSLRIERQEFRVKQMKDLLKQFTKESAT